MELILHWVREPTMTQSHQVGAGAAFFSWGTRAIRSARARRRPHFDLEQLESRQLLTSIAEFAVPSGTHSFPDGIAAGTNGNLWFTEYSANRVGSINSTTGKTTDYLLPTKNAEPFRIVVGPDKNVWFTE